MVEEFRPLNIGFIGRNSKMTDYGFKLFIENNREHIAFCNKTLIMLKDETTITPLYSHDSQRGKRFDQLVLFNDHIWNIREERREDIAYILTGCMNTSCVPEEFQLLEYNDDFY